MGEFEAVGDAVTGALLGRAVEPGAGERHDRGHFNESACLNCGTALVGPYCSACGQQAHLHRTLVSLVHDFIAGLFNFEGKIWRTLPMLAWRPGEMTKRYIAGERARFVSPVAIYLFSVFLMFAVLNFNGTIDSGRGSVKATLAQAVADERASIAKLEEQRLEITRAGGNTASIDRRLAAKKGDLADLEKVRQGGAVTAQVDGNTPPWLKPVIENAQKDPEAFVLNIQDAASKFSWLLIPLSVPFLWLLFPFNRRYCLYDHTVFVTYSLSFMMMLVIVSGLLIAAGLEGVASFLFFVPPVHMYRQLKGAYNLRWWSALLRTVALTIFAFVAAVLFAMAMVAIGVLE